MFLVLVSQSSFSHFEKFKIIRLAFTYQLHKVPPCLPCCLFSIFEQQNSVDRRFQTTKKRILWNKNSKRVGRAIPDQLFHIFCGLEYSSIAAWGSQTTSIEALASQTQHKNSCFSVKAKFKLFFRQTSLHQNVKHLVRLFWRCLSTKKITEKFRAVYLSINKFNCIEMSL